MKANYFNNKEDIDIKDFEKICCQTAIADDFPCAQSIEKNIVIYSSKELIQLNYKSALKNELHHCLINGPGVFVIKNFFDDTDVIDRHNLIYNDILLEEKKNQSLKCDHFSSTQYNDRIWNIFEKLCFHSPNEFIDYYSNPLLHLVSEAWLGTAYQISAQVNIVKSGAGTTAQQPHRDYHLGFQCDEDIAQIPSSLQKSTQFLTLQGGIAHTDMPLESGPTRLLPFSQQYDLGYMAFRNDEFVDFFEKNTVQIPLQKGDALFFNPAVFHGAGENKIEGYERVANLLQISAAFSVPMESIDRQKMIKHLYPLLLEQPQQQHEKISSIVAAVAHGYPFPTDLDKIPPTDGNMPQSSQHLALRAIEEKWHTAAFNYQIDKLASYRL